MRKTSSLYTALLLLFGGVACYLQSASLLQDREWITDPMLGGYPASAVLQFLSVVVVVLAVLAALLINRKFTCESSYAKVFSVSNIGKAGVLLLFSLLLVVFSVLWSVMDWTHSVVAWFFVGFAMLSGVSLFVLSVLVYSQSDHSVILVCSIVPILFCCFWLVVFYRKNAANPNVLEFCYPCLALMAMLLSFYFDAGFVYGRPKLCGAVFSHICGVYFCFISVAEFLKPIEIIAFLSLAVIQLLQLDSLLRNLVPKKPAA